MRKFDRPPVSQAPLFNRFRLRFRARTANGWIDGVHVTAQRRLSDAVNRDDAGGVLLAEDVRIEGQDGRTEGDGQPAEFGCINLASVLFFVPVSDGSPPQRDSFMVVKTRSERVKVGIGPYEMTGKFFLLEDARLRDAIASPKPTFLVLAAARIRRGDGTGSIDEYPAVFVNRRLTDYIVPVGSGKA